MAVYLSGLVELCWEVRSCALRNLENVRKLDFFDVVDVVNTGTSSGQSASAYADGAGSANEPA